MSPRKGKQSEPLVSFPVQEDQNAELPEGWTIVDLNSIGRWSSGGTPSRSKKEYFGEGFPWVKSGDLPDGPIIKTDESITRQGLENSAAKLMPPGTICMALYGATIGKLGILTFEAATNQASANLIPDNRLVDTMYVFHYLMAERQRFIDMGQGGAQPNISQEIVRRHNIKLPPLAEQRRIVAKLEELLGKVSSSQQRLSRVPGLLKRFRQSVLAAACSGRLTADWREKNSELSISHEEIELRRQEVASAAIDAGGSRVPRKHRRLEPVENAADLIPATWIWVSPRHIANAADRYSLAIGPFGSSLKVSDYQESGVPLVFVRNIRSGELGKGSTKYVSNEKASELNAHSVYPHDVLITKMGDPPGDARCYPDNAPKAVITADCIRLSVDFAIAVPRFIENAINSQFVREQILSATLGVAQPKISLERFETVNLPLPPLLEQQEIVRRVEKLFAFADQIETRLKYAQEHVDRLTQSILAKVFRGELVPTEAELARREGRDYETASELLARIQATQATNSQLKPKRKKAIEK